MSKLYTSREETWQNETMDTMSFSRGLTLLWEANNILLEADYECQTDKYESPQLLHYNGSETKLTNLEEGHDKLEAYNCYIHDKVGDAEFDFAKTFSKIVDRLANLNITEYTVTNRSLDTTASYMDEYGNTYEYKKGQVNLTDVLKDGDIVDMTKQWEAYQAESGNKITYDTYLSECFKTSFSHETITEGWKKNLDKFLNWVPIVGGVKDIIFGIAGENWITGDTYSTGERVNLVGWGVISLLVDVFTYGTAGSLLKAGGKGLVKGLAKIFVTDLMMNIGADLAIHGLVKLGVDPRIAPILYLVAMVAGAKYLTWKQKKEMLEQVAKTSGLTARELDDILKYTGMNADEFIAAVSSGNLNDILGIPGMNEAYLMSQTGKSADEITEWLAKNGKSLDGINGSNIDEMIHGIKGANNLLDDAGKFSDSALETKYQDYVKRNSNAGKNVRDRLDWKEASDTFARLKEQGRNFELEKLAEFKKVATDVQEQITIVTNDGTKIVVDAIGYDKNTGALIIQEYKSSATAPFTDNQIIGFPQLTANGGVVVGNGKGVFVGGFEIPSGTEITVIRPK